MNNPQVEHIINHKDMDRSQRDRQLRRYLKQRRYPKLSQAEARFEEEKKALKLENRIRLQPPPHFEGQTYTFQLKFNTLDEFKKHLKTLRRVSDHPGFKRIIS